MNTKEAKEIAKMLNDLPKEKRQKEIYQILISGLFSGGVINDILEDLQLQTKNYKIFDKLNKL